MARLTFAAAALLALAVVAGLGTFGRDAGPSEAGIVPHISTDPLTDDAPVGGDVEFNFNVENVANLGGWELDIAYDEEVLVFETFTSGAFLESTRRIETCQDVSFPEAGVLRIGCTTIQKPGPVGPSGQTDGPSGAGTLGELEFQGLCAGESAVTFSDSSIFTVFGVSIAHSTSQGSTATITGKPVCAEPTATPVTPTSTLVPTFSPPPTATPVTPTSTLVPTFSPPPTSTPEKPCGDANDDGEVGALDALVILQKVAGFLEEVSNPDAADANGDGEVDSLDALLILQKGAGLLEALTC